MSLCIGLGAFWSRLSRLAAEPGIRTAGGGGVGALGAASWPGRSAWCGSRHNRNLVSACLLGAERLVSPRRIEVRALARSETRRPQGADRALLPGGGVLLCSGACGLLPPSVGTCGDVGDVRSCPAQ